MRQGTASPLSRVLLTAGGAPRAHALPVTFLITPGRGQGGHLGHPRHGQRGGRGIVTRAGLHVAHGAMWAAVDVVVAAHRLRQWAAGPFSSRSLAAGGFAWTGRRIVTLAVGRLRCPGESGHLGQPRHHRVAGGIVTCAGGQVADGAMGAAVEEVVTADRLG